jgi:hypothetical protein
MAALGLAAPREREGTVVAASAATTAGAGGGTVGGSCCCLMRGRAAQLGQGSG